MEQDKPEGRPKGGLWRRLSVDESGFEGPPLLKGDTTLLVTLLLVAFALIIVFLYRITPRKEMD